MNNQGSPETAQTSGNNTSSQNTLIDSAEKPAPVPEAPPQASQKAGNESVTLYHGSPATFGWHENCCNAMKNNGLFFALSTYCHSELKPAP
ncbi:hypothetical protein HZL92_003581 [Salmonella enterica]|nr:hypothetical protein [Salmonella enterica]